MKPKPPKKDTAEVRSAQWKLDSACIQDKPKEEINRLREARDKAVEAARKA